MLRALYLVLGLFFVAVGFIGIFLPVLPTVPFLILAAGCFARSSTRLEAWLLQHKTFGPLLREWRDKGAIPLRAKWMALGGCVMGYGIFQWRVAAGWPLSLVVFAIMAFGVGYVFTRPTA